VNQGETFFVGKGERFRPVFPQGDTESVCLPAFTPEPSATNGSGGNRSHVVSPNGAANGTKNKKNTALDQVLAAPRMEE
jgi:hypothetical protein